MTYVSYIVQKTLAHHQYCKVSFLSRQLTFVFTVPIKYFPSIAFFLHILQFQFNNWNTIKDCYFKVWKQCIFCIIFEGEEGDRSLVNLPLSFHMFISFICKSCTWVLLQRSHAVLYWHVTFYYWIKRFDMLRFSFNNTVFTLNSTLYWINRSFIFYICILLNKIDGTFIESLQFVYVLTTEQWKMNYFRFEKPK